MSDQHGGHPQSQIESFHSSQSIIAPGGSGLAHAMSGEIGASLRSSNLNNTMISNNLNNLVNLGQGAFNNSPLDALENLAPIKNIGQASAELKSNAQGIAPQIKSFGSAIGADLTGKTGPISLNTNQGQQQG